MLTADGGNRILNSSSAIYSYADPEEGGGGGSGPLKNHKNIGFLSNTRKITKLPSQQSMLDALSPH